MSRYLTVLTAGLPLVVASLCVSPLAAQDSGTPGLEVETSTAPAAQTKGERRLAKLLEGRVAGEPVRCIRALPSQRMTTIDGTAYVYGSGNTIYVQRTRNPDQIDESDALVMTRFNGSQMCRLDQTTTVNPVLGYFTGAVFFEDFVPYTRVRSDDANEG
ncbi:MAG: hypothetical protein GW858_09955 [Sphingomonadales bacterium]|nr:hypothetical protein [Sphingomonadales bacterium]NCQ20649.1 hypothetical protein [Sphingomonadales bacterium]NCT04155.1 hypothetical protein [Sphingomonadales bacterium]